ncbi:putative polynucleotide kinase3phosphatase [Phaeomoniella chlamydospora]|uniref:Putative polynucleotide kinase3phosphatase n=1 Tax=Phaeomoniella chlamydospora TaxID=158046 RepID=A0A0G2GZR5_PHACM|nr:putative polynucleotide kinase3phosphatase [Phaeomoniella chlamydospora]
MSAKRPPSPSGASISPPPLKRKIESTTTSKAIATFFKPASQKKPEQIIWRIVNRALLIAKYTVEGSPTISGPRPRKIAAFDLDDTLIKPVAGNKWLKSATSWQWWDASVPQKLRELHAKGFQLVIISNQSGIGLKDNPKTLQKDSASLTNFKNQVSAVLRQLDLPISLYAATEQDKYRKPRTGMWDEMLEDYALEASSDVDMANSFYVGDAAGREKTEKRVKDHSCSDRDLAANIGIPFHTPEEYFLGNDPEPFTRVFEPEQYLEQAESIDVQPKYEKLNKFDIVIFCGSPGAGKSTFFWEHLKPLGYERVNQDLLKTRDRCVKKALEHLRAGNSVVVDNTNADPETRAIWVKLAEAENVPIRCVLFTASSRLCEHNSTINPEKRALLPGMAFKSFASRFKQPQASEGFQDITTVNFEFKGTDEQKANWSRYWVSRFST